MRKDIKFIFILITTLYYNKLYIINYILYYIKDM